MSNQSWWANKLTGQPVTPPVQPAYVAPQPATYAQPAQPSYPPNQQLTPQAEKCPGCGSANYGGASPEARKRCYDCGYPIVQSGSGPGRGVSSPKPEGPVQAAKQVQTGGWNPTTIIGKLG